MNIPKSKINSSILEKGTKINISDVNPKGKKMKFCLSVRRPDGIVQGVYVKVPLDMLETKINLKYFPGKSLKEIIIVLFFERLQMVKFYFKGKKIRCELTLKTNNWIKTIVQNPHMV